MTPPQSLKAHVRSTVIYAAIRMMPAIPGIVVLPALYGLMTPEEFGIYSLVFGAASLIANVACGVVNQPMYRFWDGRSEEGAYGFITAVAGVVAACTTLIIAEVYCRSQAEVAAFSIFAFSAVVAGAFSVRCQIKSSTRTLAFFEGARTVILIMVLVGLGGPDRTLTLLEATTALALSYFLPIIPLLVRVQVIRPRPDWLRERIRYGLSGSAWLLLAGTPWLLSKIVVEASSSSRALAAYSLGSDLAYRIFGLVNVSVVMWLFPAMAQSTRAGQASSAILLHRTGLGIYTAGSLLVATPLFLGAWFWNDAQVAEIEGQPHTFYVIILAAILWQQLSIAHKPAEVQLLMPDLLRLLVQAILVFATVSASLFALGVASPSVAMPTGMASAALWYSCKSHRLGTRQTYPQDQAA
jgi:hypothetical protein